jgi:hypothetical protein
MKKLHLEENSGLFMVGVSIQTGIDPEFRRPDQILPKRNEMGWGLTGSALSFLFAENRNDPGNPKKRNPVGNSLLDDILEVLRR